ncbi:integrase, catalytic region, zinc finger, CCHC-type containing protein, partial [Tanacetum coccineum]
MSQDVMICVMNSTAVFDEVHLKMQSSESCVKCLDLDAELLNKQNAYNDLSKSYSQLEKHCISLELTMQLNQEIFQKDSLSNNQNALEIPEYFKNNDLKAQLQAKDTRICKLKEHIKSMREIDKKEKVKQEMDEIETINIKLEHNLEPLAPRLLNNREAHIDYLKHTQEQADILRGIVEQAKAKQPSDNALDFSFETSKPEIKVYCRRPKQVKLVGSSKKAKIVQSKIANNSEPTHLWGSNATDVPSSSSLVNDRLSRLSSGSRDTNLYIISLDDMLKTSPICLLSKASKTKSWLWHHRLSHLNFGTLNKLAKDCLARGIPKLKFQKDHLCSACALGKSKKFSHQPKAEDTNQEKLYLLHVDLCSPMRVENINGKSILHQTSVARTQQNDVVERRNQTLVEVARTMLIFSKAPLFLWAEAINTACYTQNRSLIRLRYNKTPYELMHDKKP